MEKKYKLTDETNINGIILYRIEAIKDFSDVKKGDKGGFVESEDNLSHDGYCWVYNDAKVFGNAQVYDNARVFDNTIVYDEAEIFGNAKIYGNTIIKGNAKVENDSDYITFKNWWSSGRHFTWTKSNNMWTVGCFYGTGKELIKKAYKDSERSGREYERIVNYVETILKEN